MAYEFDAYEVDEDRANQMWVGEDMVGVTTTPHDADVDMDAPREGDEGFWAFEVLPLE